VLDLLENVLPAEARLALDRDTGSVSLTLPKAKAGPWAELMLAAPPAVLAERREAALAREQERQARAAESRVASAKAQERRALESQMAVEDRQRQDLQQRQKAEKEEAQADAVRVMQQFSDDAAKSAPPKVAARRVEAAPSSGTTPSSASSKNSPAAKRVVSTLFQPEESGYVEERPSLPPRAPTSTTISFTPRAFPTPLRESRAREEEDWLARNYLKLKQGAGKGGPRGALDRPFAERDPAWLKDKGNGFAGVGDWSSAEAAYNAALDANAGAVDVRLNRSLARLHLDAPAPCIADCACVMRALLGAPAEGGEPAAADPAPAPEAIVGLLAAHGDALRALSGKARGQVLKGLGRVCLAYLRAGLFAHAHKAAAALAAQDEEGDVLVDGFEPAMAALARAEGQKARGDAAVREGTCEAALGHYDAAVAAMPGYVQALLNKAAALHKLGRWEECRVACWAGADALTEAAPWSSVTLDPFFAVAVPFQGTALHAQCKLRVETRLADVIAKLAP